MSIVPRSARYNVLPMGIPSQRRSVRQGVQTGSAFKPDGTKILRINLPQQSYLDCSNTYLVFRHKITDANAETQANITANCNNTNNSETCMDNGAYSWIRNLQVQGADGTVLENIPNYNLLSRVLHRATQPNDHNESSASVLQGFGDISERQSWGTNALGRTYAIQLSASGLLSNSKYIPLKYLQGGLTIQLELDDFNRCHQSSSTGDYSYTIDQVYLHMDLCDFSDEFDAMFRNQLASEGVNIHFDTYSSHIDSLTSAGEINLEISERASSVKSVYTVMRKNSLITEATTDSLGTWTSRELQNYKYTLGTTDYPRYDVNCAGGGAVAYAEMLKGFGALGDINGGSEIDSCSWRGVADAGSDKFLEIVFAQALLGTIDPAGNAVNAGTNAHGANSTFVRFTVQGKHGLNSGVNAIGEAGDAFLVSNADEARFNASGTAGADAHTAGTGCYFVVANESENTFIAVKSQGALDLNTGVGVYLETGGAMAQTVIATRGRIRVISRNGDGGDVKFMIAQNFENHFENQILQTGVSASGAVPLSLKLNTKDNTEGGANCRVDTFVHSDKMLTIGADGLATVSV